MSCYKMCPSYQASSSRTAPVPVLSMGYGSSGTDCSSWVFHGTQTCQKNCSCVGFCTDCSVCICSDVVLPGLQGSNLLHHDFFHRLYRICSGIWSISTHSYFIDLGVCRAVSSDVSHSCCSIVLKYITETSPMLLMCPHPLVSCHRDHLWTLTSATKTLPHKPKTKGENLVRLSFTTLLAVVFSLVNDFKS